MSCKRAVACVAIVCCVVVLQHSISVQGGKEQSALEAVKNSGDPEWSKRKAREEVDGDIQSLLDKYDQTRGDLESIMKEFKKTRIKDVGIRKVGIWGITLARVYDLPDSPKNELWKRMRANAEVLMESYTRTYSYIEDAELSGWPMYVRPSDKVPSFEAFNSGHVAMGICQAARAAADMGEDKLAGKWVSKLMDYFHDNFLTTDIEKTKVDERGWVVYVPSSASSQRAMRHAEVAEQTYCLDVPQAFNHGILAARAAMACDLAIDAIDWSKASWEMVERGWDRAKGQREMKKFIERSGDLLYRELKDGTGDYPGDSGKKLYLWQYRDLTDCPADKGTYKDRMEDIAHGPYETSFFQEYYDWGGDVSKNDIHKFVITFLSNLVHDYKAKGSKRFACAVDGTHDKTKNGSPLWPEKQCSRARELWKRASYAPLWLPLTYALRDQISDPSVRCDLYMMVKTILPMMMPGDQFDSTNFEKIDGSFGSHAIQAKYYYYNFDAVFDNKCSNMDPF